MKKTALSVFFFLLIQLPIEAQGLRLESAWHYRKGDLNKDTLRNILKTNQVYLNYNEIIHLQFSTTDSIKTAYFFRILNSPNYSQWREIGDTPSLLLPSLDGGNYQLQISDSAIRPKTILQLSIEVRRAFWEQSWFLPSVLIYGLFLIGIGIYFFSLYNLRQKIKLQDIRNKIAADLHDEVGSNLNSIAIFVELLRKQSPKELFPILERIKSNSTESVQLMQDTIWAIQAKNDDFKKFIDKIKGFATQVLAAKNISLSFENQVNSNKSLLSMEQRKNAYLIFKESINNIVKHSEASKALVKIFTKNNQVFIEIEDNGRGFDTTQEFEGNGLKNFIERAEQTNMEIEISSEINNGTKIALKIPIE